MKKRAFLLAGLLLVQSTSSFAWFRVKERAFEGSGRFDFQTVASDSSMAMVKLAQAVLANDPEALDRAVAQGADARAKFYLRYDNNVCPIDGQDTPAEHKGECWVDALTTSLHFDFAPVTLKLLSLGVGNPVEVLAHASKSGKTSVVTALLNRGYMHEDLLLDAVRANDLPMARLLVRKGANPFYRYVDLTSLAALNQNFDLFVFLVDSAEAYAKANRLSWDKKKYIDTPNPNLRDWAANLNKTPLNVAVTYGHKNLDLVKYLIQNGAEVPRQLLRAAGCDGESQYNSKIYNYLVSLGLSC